MEPPPAVLILLTLEYFNVFIKEPPRAVLRLLTLEH